MNIAIVGAGWLGCHLGYKLKDNHKVKIYEKSEIFSESSFYNQNRLHQGFHYSRNKKTRKLCYDTFNLFLNDYNHLVEEIPNNYYVIPKHQSLIDFETYKSIFEYESIPFTESKLEGFSNIEGSILVKEKYIDPIKTKKFFIDELKHNVIKSDVSYKDLLEISKENDIVLNLTNNHLCPLIDHYYELSLVLVYSKIVDKNFGAITMVDGPLFSIYPYVNSQYTVTDVQYTPIYTSFKIDDVIKYKNSIDNDEVTNIKNKIEEKIRNYYKDFNTDFEYKNYYTSVKVKRLTASADRSPFIIKEKNIISCVTGKIQGIYTLENYIKNEVINR